eukprot:GHVH01012916.1.p1 GENE.GHVH01012916.1~~GHVH01012916.1.p1  ORF type:complete len:312 (+),score=40.78 GHVH01012916.1:39-938(+)
MARNPTTVVVSVLILVAIIVVIVMYLKSLKESKSLKGPYDDKGPTSDALTTTSPTSTVSSTKPDDLDDKHIESLKVAVHYQDDVVFVGLHPKHATSIVAGQETITVHENHHLTISYFKRHDATKLDRLRRWFELCARDCEVELKPVIYAECSGGLAAIQMEICEPKTISTVFDPNSEVDVNVIETNNPFLVPHITTASNKDGGLPPKLSKNPLFEANQNRIPKEDGHLPETWTWTSALGNGGKVECEAFALSNDTPSVLCGFAAYDGKSNPIDMSIAEPLRENASLEPPFAKIDFTEWL